MSQSTLFDVLDLLKRSVDADDIWSSKELTRSAFFQEAHWAILVAGMRFATATEWVEKAKECGFPFDWRSLAAWNDDEFKSWCKAMAGKLVAPKEDLTGRFRDRWSAILDLSRYLAEFTGEAQFREAVFQWQEAGKPSRRQRFPHAAPNQAEDWPFPWNRASQHLVHHEESRR